MVFKRKYTEDNVIEILSTGPKTTYEISKRLQSSKVTMFNLLNALIEKNIVSKRNRGDPGRPTWEYYLLDKSIIQNKKIMSLKGLGREL